MAIRCDIFCKVVDNFGDAGVCWRLARQLAREHGWRIRLWIDDISPLCGLRPGIERDKARQEADGVEIRPWTEPLPADATPAQVVIEAFACHVPIAYVDAMAKTNPVWINLEYLSAEEWVAGCHRQASPHPSLPLTKFFFFPGFSEGTGGLLRERDADFGPRRPSPALSVSLFCYDNPALPALLDAWSRGDEPLVCHVADGMPRRQVASWLGEEFTIGASVTRGALALRALPFVPQQQYDLLLGACDLNFVRGEDSFVRGQWAERPFVWQIYPQDEDAHDPKLDAFLERYTAGLPASAAAAARSFFAAWNGDGDVAAAWPALRAALPDLAEHAAGWAEQLAAPGYLAENLAKFCLERI